MNPSIPDNGLAPEWMLGERVPEDVVISDRERRLIDIATLRLGEMEREGVPVVSVLEEVEVQ